MFDSVGECMRTNSIWFLPSYEPVIICNGYIYKVTDIYPGNTRVKYNIYPLKTHSLTCCNLGTVRDRHINPYIFINVMKRRIQNRVGGNLKIQISNGQKFKFLTVKIYFSTNTDSRPSNQFIKIPKAPGHHFKSFLSYRWSIIWFGAPNPAVEYLSKLRKKT